MNNNLIDQFIDYYWLTSGASKNTLSAIALILTFLVNGLIKNHSPVLIKK